MKELIIKNINTNLCLSRKNKTDGLNIQCDCLKSNNLFCKKHSLKWCCYVLDMPDKKTIDNYKKFISIKETEPLTIHDFIKNRNLKLTIPLLKKNLNYYKLSIKGKKQELKDRLQSFFERLEFLYNNEDKIIKIQRKIKNFILNNKIKLRGEGIINKQKILNKEDFFTLESIDNLEEKYFFSFKDRDNFIYAFDIRSFKKLVDKKMSNPYNRNPIPEYAKENLQILLKNNNFIEDDDKLKLSSKQQFKMNVIRVFQLMDELNLYAGGLNIDWFLNLNIQQLKSFYKHLEDIWNYRAQINQTIKYDIIGNYIIFSVTVYDFYKIKCINKCRNILLKEMEKLLTNGVDTSSKYLGGLYILTALCNVSSACAICLPWLLQ